MHPLVYQLSDAASGLNLVEQKLPKNSLHIPCNLVNNRTRQTKATAYAGCERQNVLAKKDSVVTATVLEKKPSRKVDSIRSPLDYYFPDYFYAKLDLTI